PENDQPASTAIPPKGDNADTAGSVSKAPNQAAPRGAKPSIPAPAKKGPSRPKVKSPKATGLSELLVPGSVWEGFRKHNMSKNVPTPSQNSFKLSIAGRKGLNFNGYITIDNNATYQVVGQVSGN